MYKKGEWGWGLTAVLTILWLFFLIAAYFWAHKPFDLPLLVGLGRTLGSVVVWLGMLWLATALGAKAIGDWRLAIGDWQIAKGWAWLGLCGGLGLAVLSLLTLVIGLVGLLQPLVAWGMVLLLAVGVRRELTAVFHTLPQLPKPTTRFERWLALYAIASLLIAFLLALTPETAWDALTYHLVGPQLFADAGRIAHLRDIAFLGFPQLGEMQFLLGILLWGDGIAQLLHFSYGMLGIIMAAALARQSFGREAAWLTAVILLTIPLFLEELGDAYVDLTLLFYAMAVFYLFYQWQSAPDNRTLGLLGLFCGFAAGVKYTAIIIPIAIGLVLLWQLRREPWGQMARQLGILTAVTTLITLPWLLKNWLTTGNPVYPFFFNSGLYWDVWRSWSYARPGTGLLATAPWRLLTAPFEATILGSSGSQYFDATIGPFVLGGLVLLPFVWRKLQPREKTAVWRLIFFFGINYLFWLWGMARSAQLAQSRLLLPMFGITAVLSALAFTRLRTLTRPQLDIHWLAQVALSLTLALLLLTQLTQFAQINPLPVLLGQETASQFRQRRLGVYQQVLERINQLPPASEVLFLWEPRSYGCRVICHPDSMLDFHLHATHYQGQDAAAIAAAWRRRGLTHVLINHAGLTFLHEQGFEPITDRDLAILQQLIDTALDPVTVWEGSYTLYTLR